MGVGYSEVANYTNTSSGTASGVTSYGGVGGPYEYCSFFSVLNWFKKGEPGAWYDPSDFQPNWRRNLLTYTEDFSNAAWAKTGATINTGVVAPNGTNSQKIKSDVSSTNSYVYRSFTPSAGPLTFSVYAKSDGTCNWFEVILNGSGIGVSRVWINLITGEVGTVTGGWSNVPTPISIGDGWFRISCTTTVTATSGFYIFSNATGDGIDAYAGDGTSGIYIWGAQLEQSSSPSTYQKITDGIQDYYTVQPQPVLFQDSAGTIPVTAVEQPVGLMLDKSKGLALGAELVTNGDFSNGTTGWSLGAGVVISNGEFISTASSSNNIATTTGTFYANNTYLITLTVSQYTSGVMNFRVGVSVNAGTLTPTGIGKYSIYVRPTGDGTTFSIATGALTATLDNISVKQIAGNHAFQGDSTSTPAKRPMLSARVNLLTYSQDFRNTATAGSARPWVYDGITLNYNAGIAPDNTLTAGYLTETTATAIHILNTSNSITLAAIGSFTYSVYFKKGLGSTAPDWIQISTGGASSCYANFNLTTGLVGNFGGGQGITATNPTTVGDGWYRCSITLALAGVGIHVCYSCFTNNTDAVARYPSYGGQITSDVQTWGADLRPTNAGALLSPYQRVNTASDYDTVGFPLYLKANGTSSAMSTNSIDFTSTDKMTVVTGVRNQGSALSVFLSTGVNINTDNGSFDCLLNGYTAGDWVYDSRGTLVASANSSAYLPPISKILAGQSSISTPLCLLRLNGSQISSISNTQGIGNFGNYPLYLFARAGTQYFLNGQFYGAIIRGAQSDTASVTQTENYMAQKTGITF
jgi:hypothetical protein